MLINLENDENLSKMSQLIIVGNARALEFNSGESEETREYMGVLRP